MTSSTKISAPNATAEQMLSIGDVEICVSTFGSPQDPTILLLAGGASSMLFWDDEFCKQLAAGSRFIIRFDQRDTGRSTTYPLGQAPYNLRSLADDALGVLDAFTVDKAHLFGFSLGGAVGQLIAEDNPGRALSLIQMSTSPVGPYREEPDLAPMTDELLEKFHDVGRGVDFSNKEDTVRLLVNHLRLCSSPAHNFDEVAETAKATRNYDRSINIQASFVNIASEAHKRWPRERLCEITAPTLVIHGEDDLLIPLAHAVALKNEIQGAELLTLKGIGHELPAVCWDKVIPAVLVHTERH
jgi:pimeloyl-ACP methyl ester carboxylesterase